MGLRNLSIKPEYRSFQDNIIEEFYIPVLKEAIIYKRAVGFFSSTALIEITKGLKGLIENGGTIQLIASPQLSAEDIKAIETGYKTREEVVSTSVLSQIDFNSHGYFERKRLNLLAWLVSQNILDIKIAFIDTEEGIGIYHEKVGIIQDQENNKLVFTGSLNETVSALTYNYESFDVFCSWKNENKRIESKELAFDKLWNNSMENVMTIDFPDIAREKIKQYIFEEPDFSIDKMEGYVVKEKVNNEYDIDGPKLPKGIDLRPYQLEAIKNWKSNSWQGIFDMATGTGKTITGLSAATELFKNNHNRLAIVIVCPYQHLVEQWVEDIVLFNMNPIIGYSKSRQKDWRDNLNTNIDAFNYNLINNFCLVTTNATFSTTRIQDRLKRIQGNLLLIVDEAHNFGARHLSKSLLENAKFRLALSATIDRHNDEEGTNILYNYFGQKCIEYTLKDAINNDMLTPYEYYPIPVHLTEEELEEYKKLTAEISKRIIKDRQGKIKFKESAKHYLILRARLIAGAKNKLGALRKAINIRKKDNNILVYCGAATINDTDYTEGLPSDNEVRQIDAVTDILGNQIGMHVAKFTSEEDTFERENLIQRFANNDNLQALIAIRCLDEGVNIPSIQTAYILASSTNPKEYIQRRGRVLRKHSGKNKAIIYDFITLPVPLEGLWQLDDNELKSYRGLISREVIRMKDFVSIAENPSSADFLIYDLESLFNLNINEEVESEDEQFI